MLNKNKLSFVNLFFKNQCCSTTESRIAEKNKQEFAKQSSHFYAITLVSQGSLGKAV